MPAVALAKGGGSTTQTHRRLPHSWGPSTEALASLTREAAFFHNLFRSLRPFYHKTGPFCRSPCALFSTGLRGKLSSRGAHHAHCFLSSQIRRPGAEGRMSEIILQYSAINPLAEAKIRDHRHGIKQMYGLTPLTAKVKHRLWESRALIFKNLRPSNPLESAESG